MTRRIVNLSAAIPGPPIRILSAGIAFVVGLSSGLFAQTQGSGPAHQPDSVVVTPGARYGAGGLKALMYGRAYRDLWTTPIKVEVADLATLGGGLSPLRRGGGAQTKVLHVQGADGKRYVFRSVEKFASQGIPPMVQGTPYEAVLQDEVSSLHPTAALVVGPMLRAVNVLHVEPRLVVIPDDPRLGAFREAFAGMLALFEERPDEGPDNGEGFAGSRRISGSERLFELIEQNPQHRVDERAYLTARLVDIFLGDRDRSIDNWWWARFDAPGGGYEWRAIPRDRDQALIRLDGVMKTMLRFYEPELAAMGVGYSSSNIVGLTRSAWDLDRRFLVGVERPTWDSIVHQLQDQLTDSVIDASVGNMPPEHVRLEGTRLVRELKQRRDQLAEAASGFYRIVSAYADVHGTDQPELAVLTRFEDGEVEVNLYQVDTIVGQPSPLPYFNRVFDPGETREIRLYLNGGRDEAMVLGRSRYGIKIRVMGGDGLDVLVDSSETRGSRTHFYDAQPETQFVTRPATTISRLSVEPPVAWRDDSPQHPDWGAKWARAPQVSMGGDLGFFFALGAARTSYGFLKDPYKSRTELQVGYATGPPGFALEFTQTFRDTWRDVHPGIHAHWSEIEVVNFFGFGNETPTPPSREFFRLQRKELRIEPSLTFSNSGPLAFTWGLVMKRSIADTTGSPTLLSVERPYGSGGFLQFGTHASFTLDTRDRPNAPAHGVFLSGGGSYFPAIGDVENGAFGEIHGEASAYVSPFASANQTLVLRLGAKKTFGTTPFHEAAVIGGRHTQTVRGFYEQRFMGDASVFANTELRLFLTRFSFLVPAEFGVFGLTDVGRVFYEGESSSTWHAAYGGGIWIAPFRRVNTFSASVAHSTEQTRFYFSSGFLF
jgi:hypothetical protein